MEAATMDFVQCEYQVQLDLYFCVSNCAFGGGSIWCFSDCMTNAASMEDGCQASYAGAVDYCQQQGG
jgi:hypothetical protein